MYVGGGLKEVEKKKPYKPYKMPHKCKAIWSQSWHFASQGFETLMLYSYITMSDHNGYQFKGQKASRKLFMHWGSCETRVLV